MTKLSKRTKVIQAKVDRNKFYSLDDALNLVKECATAKFDESIDVAVQLGIDAKNLTKWFAVQWYCLRVLASMCG